MYTVVKFCSLYHNIFYIKYSTVLNSTINVVLNSTKQTTVPNNNSTKQYSPIRIDMLSFCTSKTYLYVSFIECDLIALKIEAFANENFSTLPVLIECEI